MNETGRDKAISRIRKLLEFNAGNNATSAEISNAAAIIGRILREHDLSMVDVDMQQIKSDIVACEHVTDYKTLPEWMISLSACVALAMDCTVVYGKKSDLSVLSVRYALHFIGTKSDAEITCILLFL